MSKAIHKEYLTRGDKFSITWRGGEEGDTFDWSSASVSMRIIDTADDSQVQVISPTVTTSGDDNEIINADFEVTDTSAWPVSTLKGDIEVSGEPTLGTHTPWVVFIYITKDTTT